MLSKINYTMKGIAYIFLICITYAYSARVNLRIANRKVINPRIVGGEEAIPHSIPYQVAVIPHGILCSGSLITTRHILTNAFCRAESNDEILLGIHNIVTPEDTQVKVIANRTIVHPDYVPWDTHDNIAIIELTEEVTLNENIQTVALAADDSGSFAGEIGKVAGWGITTDGQLYGSDTLQYVNSTILSNEQCQEGFGSDATIHDNEICLDGAQGRSACLGDDGSPLVVLSSGKPVQVGIMSAVAFDGCQKGFPSVYTRVSSYAKWIEENIK